MDLKSETILDSERSDKCIVFTLMYVLFIYLSFIPYYVINICSSKNDPIFEIGIILLEKEI